MTEPVSDPRPKPQYGEYATPEEVAAARGPLPVERPMTHPTAHPIASPLASPDRRLPSAPQPRGTRTAAAHPAGRWNTPITASLLTIGAWFTVSSIPGFLQFGSVLSQAFAMYGVADVTFGQLAQTVGIVLLTVSLLLLVAAIGLALLAIRRGRRSIWIPVVAGIAMVASYFVAVSVVVANTPGALDLIQNH